MTKEELINAIDQLVDSDVSEAVFDLYEHYSGMILGNVYRTCTYQDKKTGKTVKYDVRVSLMETLDSIKDALWTIADRL